MIDIDAGDRRSVAGTLEDNHELDMLTILTCELNDFLYLKRGIKRPVRAMYAR